MRYFSRILKVWNMLDKSGNHELTACLEFVQENFAIFVQCIIFFNQTTKPQTEMRQVNPRGRSGNHEQTGIYGFVF